MNKFFKGLAVLLATALLTSPVACNDEESALGLDLVDSTTLFHGIAGTLHADQAWTEHEDSLLTSNYSYVAIGNYTDPLFGKVGSELYTQVTLQPNVNDIAFDPTWEFDSVVLYLTKLQLFPDTTHSYSFHFEVKQLAEMLRADTSYYAYSTLPVDEGATFFDRTLSVAPNDTILALHLDESFYPVIQRSVTAEEFVEQVRGLRIRLTAAGDEGMLALDLSSATTCLRAYYHYNYQDDTTYGQYTFLAGAGVAHFTHFTHDYSGTLFASGGRVPGAMRLYLEPFGGLQTRLCFDRDLQRFREEHPWATIHHAELVMPVAAESPVAKPDQVLALYRESDSTDAYIIDLMDLYTLSGYDGYYHDDGSYYRMRVTQHLQGLLRKGEDPGMLLILNSRRHAAQRVVFNGTATSNGPRIDFVYTE